MNITTIYKIKYFLHKTKKTACGVRNKIAYYTFSKYTLCTQSKYFAYILLDYKRKISHGGKSKVVGDGRTDIILFKNGLPEDSLVVLSNV